MDFYNSYGQGFVRVAAARHTAIGDPASNAESVLGLARECHETGCTGRLPGVDVVRLLHRGHPAARRVAGRRGGRLLASSRSTRPAAGARGRRAAALPAPHLQHRCGHPPRRACSVWRRSRTCPPTASSTSGVKSPPETTTAASSGSPGGSAVRAGPVFAASDLPDFVLHVEICEDMFVPVPPSAEAALAGATVWPTCPAARSRSAAPKIGACSPARRRCAAWPLMSTPPQGRASRPPTSHGTARP